MAVNPPSPSLADEIHPPQQYPSQYPSKLIVDLKRHLVAWRGRNLPLGPLKMSKKMVLSLVWEKGPFPYAEQATGLDTLVKNKEIW